ncbi:hypothetical protein AC1031_014133 [Aphanomyces cochlioides]|nr:hypothetical protein AC1031_014133 [Aphanomyces cochlioides]
MTLKYTNGTFNLAGQTSMKMYWGFASDLWAVTSSSTSMYGASLIRQDALFAFANQTMESVLVQNGTIMSSDLKRGGAYTVFRKTFGPFGSVDFKRVPVPQSFMLFASQFSDSLSELLVRSTNFSLDYSAQPGLPNIGFLPPPWLNITTTFGANLLCHEIAPMFLSGGVLRLTAAESQCGSYIGEYVVMTSRPRLAAAIGANLIRSNITTTETDAICTTITVLGNATCTDNLLWPSIRLFLNDSRLSDPSLVPTLSSMAKNAQNDLYELGVEIIQYVSAVNNTIALVRHNIFHPSYPSFHFMAWLLAMDWAANNREVISFQGDLDSINIISTQTFDIVSTVNPLEVPYNVAYYIRYVCLYVTACIICVATFVIFYIFLHKGHVEGWNFFEINRVAGIVWIGRTSLFIQSMATICLLSTQSLSLEQVNKVWHLVDATLLLNESSNDRAIRIFKTFLAAGEVSWLGYVLNDILMVFTAQYTTAYVIKCTIVVWSASVCFSWLSPAIHVATFDRECTFAHVDFPLVCTSGTVYIGSFTRFLSLVGVCVGTIVVCYFFERLRRPSLPPSCQESLFLAVSAKFMFQHERWIDHNRSIASI